MKQIVIYARKSSESEDRQVQSIDDQLNIMRRRAKDMGYTVIGEFIESKSAKKPGREKFNEMVEFIDSGKVRQIMAWSLDRISRNPIDSSVIQFMLQNGTLDKVITSGREYYPYDAGLLFSVESGMANQYIIDLKRNVARGMKSKIEKGWFPGAAPEGYRNDKEDHTIAIDDTNFPLVRRMFDYLISGNYTVQQILYLANNEWGYRTRKRKKMGGKPLSSSGIYKIFNNVFYTGNFLWKDEEYPGKHTPMITEVEFQRVQKILGTKGRHRPRKNVFSYTGLIQCGECGCMITAEEKSRFIKTNGKTHYYTYYKCTKKSKTHKCKQSVINKQKLEEQIVDVLNSIEILPEFKEWALEIIQRDYKNEVEERERSYENLHTSLKEKEKRLNMLTDMLLDQRIDNDDFDRRNKSLKKELAQIEKDIANMSVRRDEKIDMVGDCFKYVSLVSERFNKGSIQERREIFNSLGAKYILNDGILAIELYPWLKPLKKEAVSLTREYRRFETYKKSTTKGISSANNVVFLKWQAH